MPPARLVRRVIAMVLVLLLAASAVVAVVVLGAVRRTLPTTDGTLTLRGLTGPVDIRRNAQGVPDIYADTPEDLFMAQGFVSAQDRFFEMDLRRHVTAGRLAELVGADGVATDRAIRTMGWRRVAEAELPRLSAETRRYLQAYADGVNAYLHRESGPASIALEYLALGVKHPGYEIEPWGPVDSLAWLKAMAWDLHGNADDELARAQLLTNGMPLAQVRELYPDADPSTMPPILSTADWTAPASVRPTTASAALVTGAGAAPVGGLGAGPTPARAAGSASSSSAAKQPGTTPSALTTSRATLAAVRHLVGEGDGIGSNSWVVAGSRTSTGKPLLANDPHLALSQPGIWHQVGLHCRRVGTACPFDVTGFTFAGLPGVVIGHTPDAAWAFTNLDPDVSDFYLERVRGDRVQRGSGTEPLTTRTETIKVAGGDDIRLTVRSTRHGPIISDVDEDAARVGRTGRVAGAAPTEASAVALAWTGLVPGRTADALFALDRARSGEAVRAAAELFSAPGQNILFADRAGHIGYQAPGLVPVRVSATPGTPPGWLPAPGWDPAYDWSGYVPYAAMPHVTDPAAGYLVAANQQVTTAQQPFLTTDWTAGWRSSRIGALLAREPRITPERMGAIAADVSPDFGPQLAKALLAVRVDDSFVRQGQDTLRGWSGANAVGRTADSRAAAYVHAVWAELVDLVLVPLVGQHVQVDGGGRWALVLSRLLADPRNQLWDDARTPQIETRDSVLLTAMDRARTRLTRTQGKDPRGWDWGQVHTLTLHHPLGAGFPGLARRAVDRGPYAVPGDALSVDALGGDLSTGTQEVTHGPSMRMVVDLADLDASTWVNQSGVSGHPFDPHYDDQTAAWLRGDCYPWAFGTRAVEAATSSTQHLDPDTSGN